MVWRYGNPVWIEFGVDSFNELSELIGGRRYALVTYGEPFFEELASGLKKTTRSTRSNHQRRGAQSRLSVAG